MVHIRLSLYSEENELHSFRIDLFNKMWYVLIK